MSRILTYEEFLKQKTDGSSIPIEESVIDLINKTILACKSAEKRALNGLNAEQKKRVIEIQNECLLYAAQGSNPEKDSILKLLHELESMDIPILWPKENYETIPTYELYQEYLEYKKDYEKELRSTERFMKQKFKLE